MSTSISTFLSEIEDFRRPQGQRYPLQAMLLMIIMSIINGASGYRSMGRFMSHHSSVLSDLFQLKHGVPSHVSIRSILLGLDLASFNKQFIKWMEKELDKPSNQWISMDGKAIRSSIKNPSNSLQDFVQVVSIFALNSNLVIGQSHFMHKKALEAAQVRELVKSLDKQGLYICLDALHCQKKR